MGKNAQIRRQKEKSQQLQESLAIMARRQQRLAPLRRLIIKSTITVALTVVVLYVGWRVNSELPTIVNEMKGAKL